MVYIGTTNFMQKNRFKSVWTGTMDRKRPVLGGSVRFPQYLGWSWTSCSPRLPVLGAKNRTELVLRTLYLPWTSWCWEVFGGLGSGTLSLSGLYLLGPRRGLQECVGSWGWLKQLAMDQNLSLTVASMSQFAATILLMFLAVGSLSVLTSINF